MLIHPFCNRLTRAKHFKTGKLSKDQKLDVIHIGLCVVFIPYGYYEPIGRDKEGWIHFKSIKKISKIKCKEQEES